MSSLAEIKDAIIQYMDDEGILYEGVITQGDTVVIKLPDREPIVVNQQYFDDAEPDYTIKDPSKLFSYYPFSIQKHEDLPKTLRRANQSVLPWLMMAGMGGSLSELDDVVRKLPNQRRHNDPELAQHYRDQRRARKIRNRLKRGEDVSQESMAWLAAYENSRDEGAMRQRMRDKEPTDAN